MKRQLIILVMALVLTGCVEKIFEAKGAEALIYPEYHRFSFEIKQQNTKGLNADLERVIQQAQQDDRFFTVTYLFKTTAGKKLAHQQVEKLKQQKLLPQQYRMQFDTEIKGDLGVIISVTQLLTETCHASKIEQHVQRKDCFVESMRMKQAANKKRLAGK